MKKICFTFIILFSLNILINSQVFETERGKIEILGLKNWDAQKLLDTMKALNPNKPIHACAGEMKHNFGFAEVSSMFYIEDFNNLSSMYSVVTIIENNDNSKIKYIEKPTDSLSLLPQYTKCYSIIEKNPMIFFVGVQTYYLYKANKIDSLNKVLTNYRLKLNTVRPFWDFILSQNDVKDMNLALWILKNDSNKKNRKIALAILLNFSEYDSVWWTLMNLQRYVEQKFSIPAIEVLRALNKNPRKINWAPAINSIKYILNGTNLFAFQNSLDVLTNTQISSDLSGVILKNSSDLILTYLNAKHDKTREVATKFIQQISGDNKLTNAELCKKWLLSIN